MDDPSNLMRHPSNLIHHERGLIRHRSMLIGGRIAASLVGMSGAEKFSSINGN